MAKWIYSNRMAVCVDIGDDICTQTMYGTPPDGGWLCLFSFSQVNDLSTEWTKDPIVHTCGWCSLDRVGISVGNRKIFLNPTPSEGQTLQMPGTGELYVYDENMRENRLETVCADPLVLYYMAKAWEMNNSLEFENLPEKERIRRQKELIESRPTREEALVEIRRLGVSERVKTIDESVRTGEYDRWYEKRERDREACRRLHPELFKEER